jgi:hypothetical protein
MPIRAHANVHGPHFPPFLPSQMLMSPLSPWVTRSNL